MNSRKPKYLDKEIYEISDADFQKGFYHLRAKRRFPIPYKTDTEDMKMNVVKKMYAFPKELVEPCNTAGMTFFQNMGKPIDYMKKISTMPSLESVNSLREGKYLKEGLQEDVDYVLLSEENLLKMLYIYYKLNEKIQIPDFPIVYVIKKENEFVYDYKPNEFTIKMTLIQFEIEKDEKKEKKSESEMKITCMKLDEMSILDEKVKAEAERIMNKYSLTITYKKNGKDLNLPPNTTIEEIAVNNVIEVEIKEFVFNKTEEVLMEIEEKENKSSGMKREDSKMNEFKHSSQQMKDDNIKKSKSSTSKYGNTKSTYDYSYYDRKEKGGEIGVCGLQNLGNTCFMNSALQCFLHTIPLIKQFENPNWKEKINYESVLGNKGKLVNVWFDLIKEYWSGYKSIAPRAFKSAIAEIAPQFTGYQQHDSQELMSYLLEGIHEEMNTIKKKPYVEAPDYNGESDEEWSKQEWERYLMRDNSFITDIFAAQTKSRVQCCECNNISIRFEPYTFLQLPIPLGTNGITVNIIVMPKTYDGIKTKKINVNGKTIQQIIEEGIKDTKCESKDIEDYVLVQFGYQRKMKKIMTDEDKFTEGVEYGIIEKQEKSSNYYIIDYEMNKGKYSPKKRFPVVIDKKYSFEEIDKKMEELFKYVSWYSSYKKKTSPKNSPKTSPRKQTNSLFDEIKSKGNKNEIQSKNTTEENNNKPNENKTETTDNNTITDTNKMIEENKNTIEEVKNETSKIEMKEEEEKKMNFRFKEMENGIIDCTNEEHFTPKYISEEGAYTYSYKSNEVCGDPKTLYECFELFQKEESLENDNEIYCSKCKKHCKGKRTVELWNCNEILVIHLKRFRANGMSREKLTTLIDFPIEGLDLRNYVKKSDLGFEPIYNLYAISNHMGSLGGGHYVASARVGDKWYDFNDSSTSLTNGTSDRLVGKSAYVLFYIRKDVDERIGKQFFQMKTESEMKAEEKQMKDVNDCKEEKEMKEEKEVTEGVCDGLMKLEPVQEDENKDAMKC